METFDYDSNIILDSDTIVSGSAIPDSMTADGMMPDNMMYGDVMVTILGSMNNARVQVTRQ